MSTRCAALYRVSTARQVHTDAETDETLPVQRTAVRTFLRTHHPDWTLVAEYAEEGVSAFRHGMAERDVLQGVLRAAARQEFQVLLVFKGDRLSRQSLEYPVILSNLARCGVQTIAVADSPGGRVLAVDGQYDGLVRFIEGWLGEMESTNTSIRVRAAQEQMVRRGVWTGGTPPYGFRFSADRKGPIPLEIDPAEADVVTRMFAAYLDEGLGAGAIAARLNREGFRQRHGNLWSDWQVRRMMINPAVSGRLAYGRKKTKASGGRVNRSLAEWDQVIIGPHIPALEIIPPERWDAMRARMAAYHATHGARRRTHAQHGPLLFTGLARCGTCGGPIVVWHGVNVVRRKDGVVRTPRLQYSCLTQRSRGRDACSGQGHYSQRKVERALLPAILGVLRQLDTTAAVAEARRLAEQSLFQRRTRAAHLPRQVAEARRVREAWVARLNAYFADPAASLYAEDTLAEQVRAAEARVAEVEAQAGDLAKAEADAAAQVADLERFLADSQGWWSRFLEAPRHQQKALLHQIIERVVLHRDGFDIYYRVDLDRLGLGTGIPPVTWTDSGVWKQAQK